MDDCGCWLLGNCKRGGFESRSGLEPRCGGGVGDQCTGDELGGYVTSVNGGCDARARLRGMLRNL